MESNDIQKILSDARAGILRNNKNNNTDGCLL